MATSKYAAEYTFRGHTVQLEQVPREREPGDDNTGWALWEASNILMRYLADDIAVASLVGSPEAATFARLRILDLSTGAGLIACACAAAGATVVASDIPSQLAQLHLNVQRLPRPDSVQCASHWWGESVESLRPSSLSPDSSEVWFDLCVVSDVLFIACRDGRTAELRKTLLELRPHIKCLLFAFEERLPDDEQQFMEELGAARLHSCAVVEDPPTTGAAPAAKHLFDVTEVPQALCRTTYEESLKGAGGHADTSLWNPHLFYEPAPVRMFIMRPR